MLQTKQNKIQILLYRVGGQGRYQYTLFLIFCLKWILAAMILFSLNFFYYVPDFACTKQQMKGYDTCQQYVCSIDDQNFWMQHFEKPYPRSIALDYGVLMVCSKEWISSLLQSVSYFGSLVGYLLMSHIGDNYGRKKGQFIAWIVCIAGQVIMVLSFNLEMIGFGSFLMGFGANAAITLHYSFFKDLVLGQTRSRMIIAIQLAFSFGVSLISLLSYLISQWKYTMAFFILIPSVIAIFIFKFIEETPEFTLKQGLQTFRQSFNRIAIFNGRDELESEQVNRVLQNYSIAEENSNVALLDLFRYQSLFKIAICTAVINFSIEFIFDGTLLNLGKFGINVYFDQMLVGIVQISASIFGTYIAPKVERIKYITIALTIIGIVSILLGIEIQTYNHQNNEVNLHTILQMGLIAILRFLVNSVWGIFFVFVSELYPSEISAISYGWVSTIGTVGACAAPYIRLITANATMFVIAGFCALSVFIVRNLQETKDKTIPARIKERQQSDRKKISIISE